MTTSTFRETVPRLAALYALLKSSGLEILKSPEDEANAIVRMYIGDQAGRPLGKICFYAGGPSGGKTWAEIPVIPGLPNAFTDVWLLAGFSRDTIILVPEPPADGTRANTARGEAE